LRGTSNRFDLKARRERKAALDSVWALREAIIAARWVKIAQAMNAAAPQVTWSFVQGFAPSSQAVDVPANDGASAVLEPDIDEETNQLEIGHKQLIAAVEEIAAVLTSEDQQPATRNINKTSAIDAAVERLKRSTVATMLEDDQLQEAIVPGNGAAPPSHTHDLLQGTLESYS
jgi:type IV secretion system protein VirD4